MRVAKWALWLSLIGAAVGINTGCYNEYPNKNNLPSILKDKPPYKEWVMHQVPAKVVSNEVLNIASNSWQGSAGGYYGEQITLYRTLFDTPKGKVTLLTESNLHRDESLIIRYTSIPGGKLSSEDYVDTTRKTADYADEGMVLEADGILTQTFTIQQGSTLEQLLADTVKPVYVQVDGIIEDMIRVAETEKKPIKDIEKYLDFYRTYIEYCIEHEMKGAEEKISSIQKYETLTEKFGTMNKPYIVELYITAGNSSSEFKDAKMFLDEAHLYVNKLHTNQRMMYKQQLAKSYLESAKKADIEKHKSEVLVALTILKGLHAELGYDSNHADAKALANLQNKLEAK